MGKEEKIVDKPGRAKEEEDLLAPKNVIGMTAIKPEDWDKTGKEAFLSMLYNSKTGEILTRTPLSWLKIFTFYCIYYSFLAGFWIACLFIFFATLPHPDNGPRWQETGSLIGINPGLGTRPKNNDRDIDSNMFLLKAGTTNKKPIEKDGEGRLNADYAVRLQNFLEMYKNTSMGENMYGREYPAFNVEEKLGECGKFPYGYAAEEEGGTVAPCIILKLNKIWGWKPGPIRCTERSCPYDLRVHLNSSVGIEAVNNTNIWIDCQGRYPADQEALAGDGLTYFPESRNLPIKGYFPYEGQIDGIYHSPLVAIKVKVKPNFIGQLIHIECRAYYQGVYHSKKDKQGLTQFEVIVRNQY